MNTHKPVIGSGYDPRQLKRPDEDAEKLQRALYPGLEAKRYPIVLPVITVDGFIFAACACGLIVLFIIWMHSIFGG